MSSFLDRIRARARRANAKRARRAGVRTPRAGIAPGDGLAQLSIDGEQLSAIQNALADHSLEPIATGEPAAAGSTGDLVELEVTTEAENEKPADGNVEVEVELVNEGPAVVNEAPASVNEAPVSVNESATVQAAPGSEVVARAEFTSSNVRAATLCTDGVLFVEFKDGGKCSYGNFTLELFEEWQAAKSAGSWFHHNVRTKPDRHPVLKGE